MDIVRVHNTRPYLFSEDPQDFDEESEMASAGNQIQGDYSGYVPPEVVVTSDAAVPTSPRRKSSQTKQTSEKGGTLRPASPTEVPVLIRGNLQKLGKRLKGWHQRYFEVQGTHMYHYKNHTKKDCLGEIQLSKCFHCDATTAATFGHPFELRTTERTHTLAARTNDEMVQWVRVIRANIGTTAEEAAAKKASKPKRWESFKNALSIQPRQRTAHSDPTTSTKKKHGKSFANKFKLRGGQDRTKTRSPPPDETQMSSRPLSLTESQVQTATLDVLAALQPTRSLPSTPLTRKRPVDFDESPPPSPVSRSSAASPALTLDSVISSATSSPAHPSFEPEKEPELQFEDLPPPSQSEVPPIIVTTQDVSQSIEPSETVSLVTDTLERKPKENEKPSKTSAPAAVELPEFLRRKFAWDEIQDVFDSLDEEEDKETYDELPPEEQVWLEHTSGVEQLRSFLLACP